MHLDAAIPQSRRPFTPIILGCNLTALALALSLSRKHIPVILLARGALIPDDDAAVPLHPAAVAVLEQLGVWSQLSAHALILDGGWFGDVGRRYHLYLPLQATR
jgi:2-polyprenyl-6-methoxyphenol hydroxylase-like FAD-dependent oxidoreductase